MMLSHLHSTVVLLKDRLYLTFRFYIELFTFYCSSIKSRMAELQEKYAEEDLHSTVVLLKGVPVSGIRN